MEYKVQVYQVEGKEKLLGFANLVLEGQFVLNGFAIKEFNNGKVYLEPPRYQSYENPQDYLDYFTIKDRELREEITEAALLALQQCKDKKGEIEGSWEDEELNYTVDVNPKRNGSFLAEIRLRFQDGAIVVNQAAIYRNWKGESFVSMPHRTRKDTKEIQNVCFPITSEFSAELKECIMQQYEEKLEQQHREEPNKQVPVR